MLDQKKYWNKVAFKKDFTIPLRMDLIEKYSDKNDRILDYGCAYGRTLRTLKNSGYSNLVGVDFSEKMIERSKKESLSLDCRVVKNNQLPFEDNSFDLVLLIAVLTCVVDDKEQEEIIKEIRRVLRPGGVLYLNDFLINEDKRNQERYEKFKDKYDCHGVFEIEEGAVLRHFYEERIKELTGKFEDLEYEKIIYTTMNGNKSNGFCYLGKIFK